jgi:signal peptidase I
MLALTLTFGGLAVVLILQMVALFLLASGLGAPRVTWARVIGFTVTQGAVHLAAFTTALTLPSALLMLAIEAVIAFVLLQWFFSANRRQAAALFGCLLVMGLGVLGFVRLVYRPHVAEAFKMTANSMAPTLVGWHRAAACPHCGGKVVVSAMDHDSGGPTERPPQEDLGICSVCRRIASLTPEAPVLGVDRILTDKFLQPERWDMIVFVSPKEPTQIFVDRVVGLPGESIYIDQGQVWVNGAALAVPADLAGQQYRLPEGLWTEQAFPYARPENPCRLAADEYFVLGDFTTNSLDSRAWGPMPQRNLRGVVTSCYWPPSRWRVWK